MRIGISLKGIDIDIFSTQIPKNKKYEITVIEQTYKLHYDTNLKSTVIWTLERVINLKSL